MLIQKAEQKKHVEKEPGLALPYLAAESISDLYLDNWIGLFPFE